jgi:uncharacterized protein (AIM24 family)
MSRIFSRSQTSVPSALARMNQRRYPRWIPSVVSVQEAYVSTSSRIRASSRLLSSAASSPVFTIRSLSSVATASSQSSAAVAESKTSADGVVGIPINFDEAAQIRGKESQIAVVELGPGQVLRAESGAMMYMTEGVEMNTTTGGGLSSGFQRMLTGQNFFISDYTYTGPPGTKGVVALGTDFPSKILRLNVNELGGKIVCQKGALLCASHTVNIEMEFTKNFTSGFFGGEGFVLQKLTGDGDVFVKAGGALIRRDLKEGETLRASSGCLVAFVDAEYGMCSNEYRVEWNLSHRGLGCIPTCIDSLSVLPFRRPNGEGLHQRDCRRRGTVHDHLHRTGHRVAARPAGRTNDQRNCPPRPVWRRNRPRPPHPRDGRRRRWRRWWRRGRCCRRRAVAIVDRLEMAVVEANARQSDAIISRAHASNV